MIKRIEMFTNLKTDYDLTRSIQKLDQNIPSDLEWTRIKTSSWFQAMKGNHFALNLQTGEFLINGKRPGRLSYDIRNDAHFKETFGVYDFEVTTDSCGYERTISPMYGYFYKFYKSGDRILMQETHQSGTEKKYLLREMNFKNVFRTFQFNSTTATLIGIQKREMLLLLGQSILKRKVLII
jgi:hypothetical protein